MPLLGFVAPYLIFAASCFVSLGTALSFHQELIDNGYEEGSKWDRRFWAYFRRYENDRSLQRKRLAALVSNLICIASLGWVVSTWG